MAQGSGLSIDPPSSHLLFTCSLSSDHPQDLSLRHRHKLRLEPSIQQLMDCPKGPSTIQFPVNLNCTTADHDQDHDQEGDEDRCFKSDEKRPVIDEMDFFASKKDDEDHDHIAETDGDDQKDNLCGPQHFNVNVSLVVFLSLSFLYFSQLLLSFSSLINVVHLYALTKYTKNRLVCIFSPQTLAVISQ